ncbi:hypothetical protein O1611_g8877 [Lasiodiplodia mahajangana]|uniref:Uncharacterized protein n=1 Tax=Lasiodiplodia mahajangana TaxID=1108764 RepID=A0ACC2JBN0_9PEZI|nr:hypothetical protein O1611_g8877 [Lasiodiplodia mahajangana]
MSHEPTQAQAATRKTRVQIAPAGTVGSKMFEISITRPANRLGPQCLRSTYSVLEALNKTRLVDQTPWGGLRNASRLAATGTRDVGAAPHKDLLPRETSN